MLLKDTQFLLLEVELYSNHCWKFFENKSHFNFIFQNCR